MYQDNGELPSIAAGLQTDGPSRVTPDNSNEVSGENLAFYDSTTGFTSSVTGLYQLWLIALQYLQIAIMLCHNNKT